MLIEIILALLLGCTIGTFTGLIPGIHINLIGAVLIGSATILTAAFSPLPLVVFIISMAITHTFVDFIPSVFLGAPDEDTVLSILPGHELLKKGQGYEAILLTLFGSASAIIIILFFTPLFVLFLGRIFDYARVVMPFILIFISLFLIINEPRPSIALIVFLLAGFLGLANYNLNLNQPLLPILTGLFGSSSLIISIKSKTKVPKQKIKKIKEIKPSRKEVFPPLLAAVFSAPLCSFLPGLGSGQAAVISSQIIRLTKRKFLILLGAINTIVMGLSFITLYLIGKTRTGAAVAVGEFMEKPNLVLVILTIVISGTIAFFITINLAKFFSKKISKINYQKLSIIILLILGVIVLAFSGILGFIVFTIATFTGIFGILSGVKRINLMGAILIPTILFYLL